MRMVSAILGIALVAAGGAAIQLWREVGSERQQIADLRAQLQQREAQPAASTVAPLDQPAVSISAAPPPATTSTTASAPAAAAAPPDAGIVVPDSAAIRALMSSPEAMARSRQFGRSRMEGTYPYIGEALGLAPDEAGKLLDLLAAHQENRRTVSSGDLEQGTAAWQERQQANDAELRAMLGSRYPQWQDYQQTLSAWQQMRDLDAVATAGGNPLTAAQFRSLTAALSAEQRGFVQQAFGNIRQSGYDPGMLVRHTPERNQQMLDIAAAHLTPQQHEGYREMLDRAAVLEQFFLASVRTAMQSEAAASVPR